MKTKELKEQIKKMSAEELNAELAASQKQLDELEFAHAVNPIENPMQIRSLRRKVASLKTELHVKVTAELEDKVKAEGVTRETVSEFLQKNKFAAPVNKKMVLRAISK
ncbi:50S ribosomal protein L29 [Algivirga pacifica]|uniref:Large ribosomal subunit protein uL29 n=1 Tax=Algivirga pacifica TaxID=1162670 RepID=A0ABP9DJ93_9BACT